MQRVTCDCGNTLFFGEDEEVQVCDRCGQKVKASGVPVEEPRRPRAARAPRPDAGAGGVPEGVAPPPPADVAPLDIAAEPLVIASERVGLLRRLLRRLLSVPVLIVALVAAAGSDYYLYPSRKLPCGHVKKDSFVFGLVRIRHSCEAMEALYYLDRARTAINRELDEGGDVPPIFLAIMALPEVGGPSIGIPYGFSVEKDLSLAADPSKAESDLPFLYLELDGTVHVETDIEAGPGSPIAGRFDEKGWIVTPEEEERAERRRRGKKDGPTE